MNMLLLLLLMFLFINVSTLKWAKRKEECLVKSDYQIAQLIGADSVFKCVLQCETTNGCETISWYQSNATCLMFNKSIVEDTKTNYERWVPLSNWITYARVIYPVVRRLNPNGDETDEMTFEEAVQTCLDQHSIIASPEDLLVNRQMGMDNCYCGWLSNGLIGSITQTNYSCPGVEFSTDVVYCDMALAHAWCKLN